MSVFLDFCFPSGSALIRFCIYIYIYIRFFRGPQRHGRHEKGLRWEVCIPYNTRVCRSEPYMNGFKVHRSGSPPSTCLPAEPGPWFGFTLPGFLLAWQSSPEDSVLESDRRWTLTILQLGIKLGNRVCALSRRCGFKGEPDLPRRDE
jgi:hypothetical protein